MIARETERLLSQATDRRGVTPPELLPRVRMALAKFIFRDDPSPETASIKDFIRELRADDLCLVIACERSDEAAWESLVRNLDSTVRSAARRVASNADDADDLAGAIWAELHGLRTDGSGNRKSKLAYYSGRGSLAGWLRAVVAQLAVDEFRRRSRFVGVEDERELDHFAAAAHDEHSGHRAAPAADPEEMLDQKRSAADVTNSLTEAIAALDDEDRLIMKMYYFDSLKLKDIAATFGFHEATASRRLGRIQGEIRRTVENRLRSDHGWSEAEIRQRLAEIAAGLGVSIEKMFILLTLVVLVQELAGPNVLFM